MAIFHLKNLSATIFGNIKTSLVYSSERTATSSSPSSDESFEEYICPEKVEYTRGTLQKKYQNKLKSYVFNSYGFSCFVDFFFPNNTK